VPRPALAAPVALLEDDRGEAAYEPADGGFRLRAGRELPLRAALLCQSSTKASAVGGQKLALWPAGARDPAAVLSCFVAAVDRRAQLVQETRAVGAELVGDELARERLVARSGFSVLIGSSFQSPPPCGSCGKPACKPQALSSTRA
jgi:hypothetical protein